MREAVEERRTRREADLEPAAEMRGVRVVLLDTAFLVDVVTGDDGAVEKARDLEPDLGQQRLSAMTLLEHYYGATRSNQSEAERERRGNVPASKPVHPADTAVMHQAGRLAGEPMTDDTAAGDGDVILGTTADVLDGPVLPGTSTTCESTVAHGDTPDAPDLETVCGVNGAVAPIY